MEHRYLTENEINRIRYEENMLIGDVNRMCGAEEPYYLMTMFMTANHRLKMIHDICINKFIDTKKESEEQSK